MISIAMELDKFSRSELQKLAKEHGIKANQKTKRLLIDLKKVLGADEPDQILSNTEQIDEEHGGNEDHNLQSERLQPDISTKTESQLNDSEFMTDDESSLTEPHAKKAEYSGDGKENSVSFEDVSMLSDLMTEDDDSLLVNCTKMDPGERMKEVELPSAESTPIKPKVKAAQSKMAKPETSGKPILTTPKNESAKPETSGKPILSTPKNESAKPETSGKPLLSTPKNESAKPETSEKPILSTPKNDAESEEAEEESAGEHMDEKNTPANTPSTENQVAEDRTFSVPKKKTRRRAAPAPVKEVAKITSFESWKETKENSQHKKVSSLQRSNARRSPRIKAAQDAQITPSNAGATTSRKTPATRKTPAISTSVTKKKELNEKQSQKSSETPRSAVGGKKTRKNWMEIHAKNFNKLESIDDHQKRKKERAHKLLSSSKKPTVAPSLEKTNKATKRRALGSQLSSTSPEKKLKITTKSKPTPSGEVKNTKKANSKLKAPSTSRPVSSVPKSVAVFKPKITDVKYIKTNFTGNTAVTFRSRLKVPEVRVGSTSKTSQPFTFSSSKVGTKLQTPKKVSVKFAAQTPTKAASSSSVLPSTPSMKAKKCSFGGAGHLTPFKVGGNSFISTPKSSTNKFNLKTSLKKPLKYTPYTGPLKEFEDTSKAAPKTSVKTRTAGQKVADRRADRVGRRVNAQKSRVNARNELLMKKRALK